MKLIQGPTRRMLAGLALPVPQLQGYHQWHNTRMKEKKGLPVEETEKGKEKPRGKKSPYETSQSNPNIDMVFNPSNV